MAYDNNELIGPHVADNLPVLVAYYDNDFLDDESMETQDLEVAIQIRGCENAKKPQVVQFKLQHVYWTSDDSTSASAVEIKEMKTPTLPPTDVIPETQTPTNGPTLKPTQAPTDTRNNSAGVDNKAYVDTTTKIEEEKWGKWKFYDGAANTRPTEDYCEKYPNRDIPGKDFPQNAWQTDAV